MKNRPSHMLLLIALLLLPALSSAEIREGSFEVNPYAGWHVFGNGSGLDNDTAMGLRLGYNITERLGIEGAIDNIDTRAWMPHADVLYHFMPKKKFNPFVVGGIGYAKIRPENRDHYTTLMANLGLGFKYFLSDRIAFRADVRDVITNMQNAAVTAGLTFVFGGKTPAPAPKPEPAPPSKPEPKPEPKPEVRSKPMVDIEADPGTIEKGGSSRLFWTSKDAQSLSIDQGIGDVPAAGSRTVSPAGTTTYTITARNESGITTDSATLTVKELRIILEDIHFDFDKASLTTVAREILDKNIQTLKDHPGVNVQIEGHTCAHGPEKYNMALGERRANAVREYLMQHGISAGRMTTISYGETRLIMPEIPTPKNKESKEAKANRRVHFEVIVK